MGQLIEGKWVNENIISNHDKTGLYYKRDSVFRNRIERDAGSEFPAEPGRYHLYCAVACPWAHRATLMRTLKKLEPFVTLTNTFQEPGGAGLVVRRSRVTSCPGTDRRVRWLHELYTIADPACTTRVTVPTLVGRQDAPRRQQRVRPKSSGCSTSHLPASPSLRRTTTPSRCAPQIDATNALVLKGVNNAVNGCGYSISQQAYDSSIKLLFETLDGLEAATFATALCVRRRRDRGGLAAVSKPGALRSLLLRRLQVQSPPSRRVSEPVELSSGSVPDAGHRRGLRHRRHEARRVQQGRPGRLQRHHPDRPFGRLFKAP